MYLSENFTFKEFERSETASRLGIDNTIKHELVRNNIKELVYHILEPLRDELFEPIYINSGYRCMELNNALKATPTSQHVMGQAADIRVRGYTPYEIAKTIIALGLPFDQLGLYDHFVHISISPKQRGQIFYDKTYNGIKLD